MQKVTLNYAVSAAQILMMLHICVCRYPKELQKLTQRGREHLNRLVTLASKNPAAAAPEIKKFHDGLVAAVRESLNPELLVKNFLTRQGGLPAKTHASATVFRGTLQTLWAQGKMDSSKVLVTKDADIEHAFASLVRNVSWLETLKVLGVDVEYSAKLRAATSSDLGRQKVATNIVAVGVKAASAAANGKKATFTDADFEVTVALTDDAIWRHPVVQGIEDMPLTHQKQLKALIAEAKKPRVVEAGKAPAEVAKECLARFDKDAAAVKRAVAKDKKAAEAQREKDKEAKALAALKAMNPQLLAAIKRNPGLLEKA